MNTETTMSNAQVVADDTPIYVILFVNGQRLEWNENSITFVQVVNLVFPGVDPTVYSVMYRNGPGGIEGSLLYNETTNVTTGMIFDVESTNKS